MDAHGKSLSGIPRTFCGKTNLVFLVLEPRSFATVAKIRANEVGHLPFENDDLYHDAWPFFWSYRLMAALIGSEGRDAEKSWCQLLEYYTEEA